MTNLFVLILLSAALLPAFRLRRPRPRTWTRSSRKDSPTVICRTGQGARRQRAEECTPAITETDSGVLIGVTAGDDRRHVVNGMDEITSRASGVSRARDASLGQCGGGRLVLQLER